MTADLPKKKPLLAVILETEGVLVGEALDRALRTWNGRRQEGRPLAFGQVVLQLKLVPTGTLTRYVAMQRMIAAAPGGRKPLGLLAVETGAVKPTALVEALFAQASSGRRIGELLLDRGLLRKPQLDALLHFQRSAA